MASRGAVKTGWLREHYSSTKKDWPCNGAWHPQEAGEMVPASTEPAGARGDWAWGLSAAWKSCLGSLPFPSVPGAGTGSGCYRSGQDLLTVSTKTVSDSVMGCQRPLSCMWRPPPETLGQALDLYHRAVWSWTNRLTHFSVRRWSQAISIHEMNVWENECMKPLKHSFSTSAPLTLKPDKSFVLVSVLYVVGRAGEEIFSFLSF